MNGIVEWADPQRLAGCLAIALLGAALAIELGVLLGVLRQPRDPLQRNRSPGALPQHDFYDWLWH